MTENRIVIRKLIYQINKLNVAEADIQCLIEKTKELLETLERLSGKGRE